VQADRSLLLVLIALLLHHLINVLAGRNLGSLLLLGALGLLLRDSFLVVALVRGSLALTTFLGLAALGLIRLALLRHVSVRFEWKCLMTAYLRRREVVDVLASSLARLLNLLLFLVEHDRASLLGATFRKGELCPWDRTALGDDLEEEANLYYVSESS
jgi:hypothetical protein